jgi:hypothetical protein
MGWEEILTNDMSKEANSCLARCKRRTSPGGALVKAAKGGYKTIV